MSDDVTVTVATSSQQALISFTLINVDTQQPIAGFDPLPPAATLRLSSLPTRSLNIRANTVPAKIGSVRFRLDGLYFRTENVAPYALAGDAAGEYFSWTPVVAHVQGVPSTLSEFFETG